MALDDESEEDDDDDEEEEEGTDMGSDLEEKKEDGAHRLPMCRIVCVPSHSAT